ncbi:MAG: hypothetical protein POELPBGB_00066 [Bacteroidia bacterium]|nr:hypothetical protein [Bacteroidia bacterium]
MKQTPTVKFFLLFVFYVTTIKAQDIEFKKINWEEKPPLPASSEKNEYAGEVIFSHITIEYKYNDKGELNRYYGVHKKLKINEENFVESVNRIFIPYNNKDIVVFKARAISKTGEVKETGLNKMKEIDEEGVKYKIVAVEGLEKGGEMEYIYCYQTNLKYYLSENLQYNIPAHLQTIEIISPENLIFKGKVINSESIFSDTLLEKKNRIKFELHNILPLDAEKYSPEEAGEVRLDYKLEYNTVQGNKKLFSWGETGKKIFEAFHFGQEASLKDIKKYISKTGLKGNSIETIFKLESDLKTDIAINAEAKPVENVGEVLKNKFGNKDDLIRIYLFILEELEVKYELVVTCNRFEKKFDPTFETWDFLEEYLIYFPELKKYIDPSNRFSRLDFAPFSNTGNHALFIKPVTLGNLKSGAANVKTIEVPSIETQVNYSEYELNLATYDSLKINYFQSMSGYYADSYRPFYHFTDENKKKELAESIVKGILTNDIKIQNLIVKNFDINNPNEFEKPFEVRADVSTSSMLENAGNALLLKIGEVIGPQTQMYNEKERISPVELAFPHEYQRKIIFKIPEGYKLKGEEDLKINIDYNEGGKNLFGFISDYILEENTLTINVREYYAQIFYPKGDYENFQKVVNAAADFNKITLLLEKN